MLPDSDLNYSSYSEFVHPENVSCGEFNVGKNYEKLNDLEKIDALAALVSDDDSSDDQVSDEDEEDTDSEKVYYTCLKKKCRIPCPCAPCCTKEKQCTEHKVKHLQLFDEKEHSIVIRSSEDFCRDESFFVSLITLSSMLAFLSVVSAARRICYIIKCIISLSMMIANFVNRTGINCLQKIRGTCMKGRKRRSIAIALFAHIVTRNSVSQPPLGNTLSLSITFHHFHVRLATKSFSPNKPKSITTI